MDSRNSQEEQLVFLDFNDKLPSSLLTNEVFIRLAHLEDPNPLIQVNDLIFRGSYDYSTGTNLFFKKLANREPTLAFPYKDPLPYKLQFAESATKVLKCIQMRVPSNPDRLLSADQENMKFNFKWDYKELLKRLEEGSLNLEDMLLKEDICDEIESGEVKQTENNEEVPDNSEITENDSISDIVQPENDFSKKNPTDELENAYINLQLLARTPVRRNVEYEECPCMPQYKKDFEYRSIECKILEPPLFSYIIDRDDKLEDRINLERCVTHGLLKPSEALPRTLSNEEKQKVLSIENFDNLDLVLRYSVLLSHKEELQKQVESNTLKQNSEKDQFDRTPVETLEVFEKLLSALNRRIQEMSLTEREKVYSEV